LTGPKILLIMSEKTRRPAFAGLFKGLGCQVLTTITAENALAALDGGFKPNVIIADMEVADLKTTDFLKKIKETDDWKAFPIVSYTRLLNYKINDPSHLSASIDEKDFNKEDSEKLLSHLSSYITLAPGEIVIWVAQALQKKNIDAPLLMTAAEILKKSA
jgi:CheY-like chemotaxis protein